MSDLVELTVGGVAAGGGCVARAPDGRVVFVRHALPGERVRAEVVETTTSFLRADAREVLSASPDRVEPPCPAAGPGRCGGCDFQHVTLVRQRLLKADLVRAQLRRLLGEGSPLLGGLVVEALSGSADGLGWRSRVGFAVDHGGRLGLRRHRSHQLELLEACPLATPEVEAVGAERARWPGARAVTVAATGVQHVVAVTGRLREDPDVPAGLQVDGRPVRGPHGLRHEVLGRSFEASAGAFWQVHPAAAQVLATAVLDALDPQPGDAALDLYAGVGLFAALLGERVGRAGSVLAVEGDARACADAARNTADQPQTRVRTGAVDAAALHRLARGPKLDLVVLDPPRAGLGVAAARALAALRPRRVAYVSCEPSTFARDVGQLLGAGWSLPALRAFDAYPMTEHVELLGVLEPPPAP